VEAVVGGTVTITVLVTTGRVELVSVEIVVLAGEDATKERVRRSGVEAGSLCVTDPIMTDVIVPYKVIMVTFGEGAAEIDGFLVILLGTAVTTTVRVMTGLLEVTDMSTVVF
jgi:hypothetical protein